MTVDQIIGPQAGNLTITNGQATFTLPSYQTAPGGEAIITQNNASTLSNKTFDSSSNIAKQAFAVFDFGISGGAVGQYPLAMNLPNKAVIVNSMIDVITAPVGGTVSVGAVSVADILAASTNPQLLVSSRYLGKPVFGSTSNVIKLAASTGAFLNIGTSPLTAGKFAIELDYFISQ